MKKIYMIIVVLIALPCIVLASPVPDTGQTKCYDDSQEIPCPQPSEPFYGQDAQYPCNPQSYTKLDSSGDELPHDAPWPWAMVKDNVTGLVWEVKTDDGSIHDQDNAYVVWDIIHSFIVRLNAQNFGGYSDWRLPAVKELSTIVIRDVYKPSINTFYFPNTMLLWYWSSTPFPYQPLFPEYIILFALSYYNGCVSVLGDFKSGEEGYVRAVQGEQTSNSFIDNADGTVTETNTGLMWQQDTAPGTYTWQQALAYCENLILAGYNDWRLPNVNELQSIVDYSRDDPAIDTIYFPNTESKIYWSSSTYVANQTSAWMVGFYNGGVYSDYDYYRRLTKSDAFYVRAVRGGFCRSDSDEDGIFDFEDDCPKSSLDETIIIYDCDSEVANQLFDNGCTMSDLITECANAAKNHGKFIGCLSHLTNDWKNQKLISGKYKGAIQSCAAQANIP